MTRKAKTVISTTIFVAISLLGIYFYCSLYAEPKTATQKAKPIQATIRLREPWMHRDLFQQITSKFVGDLPWWSFNLRLHDPTDIQELLAHFEGIDDEVPRHPPHGYAELCSITVGYDDGRELTIITNYYLWFKGGRGDWQASIDCEEFILKLFLDDARRDQITIEVRPNILGK